MISMKTLLWCFAFVSLFDRSYQKVWDFESRWGDKALLRSCKVSPFYQCYMRGYFHSRGDIKKSCEVIPYLPGGGIKNVGEVKAPTATLQKKFLGIVAKGAGILGNTGKVAGVMNKFDKIFDKASKMAPWLGALGAVFGFIGKSPSAQDAVDATNGAIKELATEVNDRLGEMKVYVGDNIRKSEADWISREYEKLYNGWGDCMVQYLTVEHVNECQAKAFGDIRKARSHFLLFKNENRVLTRDEIKQLEVKFLSIRDYALLNLMVLKSLMDSFKAEEGKIARQYYVNYLKLTVIVAKELSEYANYANGQIMNFYGGAVTRDSCSNSIKCGGITDVDETSMWEAARVMSRYRDCYCKMRPDVLDNEWCKYEIETRVDYIWDDSQYTPIDFSKYVRNHKGDKWDEDVAMRVRGTELLLQRARYIFGISAPMIRKYWYDNVMSIVPLWEEIGNNAQVELDAINNKECEWISGEGMNDGDEWSEVRFGTDKIPDKETCLATCKEKEKENNKINGVAFAPGHGCLCEIDMDGRNHDSRYISCIFKEKNSKRSFADGKRSFADGKRSFADEEEYDTLSSIDDYFYSLI